MNHVPIVNHYNQPHSVAKLTQKFILGEIVGRPRVVNIEVTLRCNAKCDFCSHWRAKQPKELEDYSPVVKKFRPMVVNLTGGEPLMRKDLPQLILKIKQAGPYYLTLLTNGALLTIEKAEQLRVFGLDGLSISLNYGGQSQDRERRINGLFQHLSKIIPHLPRIGFSQVDINAVILDSNLSELVLLAHLARTWGVRLNLSCYSAMKTNTKTYQVQSQDALERVVKKIQELKARGWPIGNSDWYLNQIPRFYREGGIPNCRAGRRTVHVTPDGYVKPCPDFPVVSHYKTYETRTAKDIECTKCWYRCRGEVEAPLGIRQIAAYAALWRWGGFKRGV